MTAYTGAGLLQEVLLLAEYVEGLSHGKPSFKTLLRAVNREARVARSLAAADAEPAPRAARAGIGGARLQGLANNLYGLRAELEVAEKA